jgi:hypothetical protein
MPSQLINAPLDRRPAIDRRGGLDRGMALLRLDHIERHLPSNRPGAKRVAQPLCCCPRQSVALIGRQIGGPHGLGQPALDMLVERLLAHRRHGIQAARQQRRARRRLLDRAQAAHGQVVLQRIQRLPRHGHHPVFRTLTADLHHPAFGL